jgi:hypothetical protein
MPLMHQVQWIWQKVSCRKYNLMAYLIKNNLDILTGRKIEAYIFIMHGFKIERQVL